MPIVCVACQANRDVFAEALNVAAKKCFRKCYDFGIRGKWQDKHRFGRKLALIRVHKASTQKQPYRRKTLLNSMAQRLLRKSTRPFGFSDFVKIGGGRTFWNFGAARGTHRNAAMVRRGGEREP